MTPELPIDLEHAALLASLVLGLTQSLKQVGIPSEFLPFVAMFVGAGANVALVGLSAFSILSGIVLGLTVSGVVSRIKNL